MLRMLAPLIWIVAIFAVSVEAAQPCAFLADRISPNAAQTMMDAPCHEGMLMQSATDKVPAPQHPFPDSCCCTVLVNSALSFQNVAITGQVPRAFSWAVPVSENATSIDFEFETPPPRA